MGDVLSLNGDFRPLSYFPLSTTTWWEAVRLVYCGKFTVVHAYEDWIVRSPSFSMAVPSVIVAKEFYQLDKLRQRVTLRSRNVFLRDMYTCQFCDQVYDFKDLTLDHVVPRSQGGPHTWENLATACKTCNQQKGDLHPFNARDRARAEANDINIVPVRRPFEPSYYELAAYKHRRDGVIKHHTWEPYLQLDRYDMKRSA